MVRLLWQGITSGRVLFPGGRVIELDFDAWRSLVDFVFKRIDGDKLGLEVDAPGGQTIQIREVVVELPKAGGNE